jgi:hypothetical protein
MQDRIVSQRGKMLQKIATGNSVEIVTHIHGNLISPSINHTPSALPSHPCKVAVHADF